jgi:glucose-6-phosphate isomerase
MAGTTLSQAQAWAILKRHAKDEIALLRLNQLCRDDERVSSLVAVYNPTPNRMLLLDLSRQRMTLETVNHLLRLATARSLRKYITALAWGQNNPEQPVIPKRVLASSSLEESSSQHASQKFATFSDEPEDNRKLRSRISPLETAPPIPSLHLCLRVPANKCLEMFAADGTNILPQIHSEWERIRLFSENFRRGKLPGVTGALMKDLVIVGQGVPVQALRFVYLALLKDASGIAARCEGLEDLSKSSRRGGSVVAGRRKMKFLTSIDPVRAAAVVADLDPASTMIVSIAIQRNEETSLAAEAMKKWLLQGLGAGHRDDLAMRRVLSKHMILVTGDKHAAAMNKPQSVFLIPEHFRCEAFTTFTAATLLVSK